MALICIKSLILNLSFEGLIGCSFGSVLHLVLRKRFCRQIDLLSRRFIIEIVEILELLSAFGLSIIQIVLLEKWLLVINNIKVKHPSFQAWVLLLPSSGRAQLVMGQPRLSLPLWEELGEEERAYP